jgi:lipoprotein-releasing system ATP-binding protein
MSNYIIETKNLTKKYKSGTEELAVLKGINVGIKKGEIVAIVGESGSGKSTFLNMLGGLDRPSSGNIFVEGLDIANLEEEELTSVRNKSVGFVFQFHNLLLDFSAMENIMLPSLANSFDYNSAKEKALKILDSVGLLSRKDHLPSQLSGGEQQRVSVARALINSPSIILADEPTGNLDLENSENVRELLWKLAKELDITLVVVTHNSHIAGKADKVLKMDYGYLKEE